MIADNVIAVRAIGTKGKERRKVHRSRRCSAISTCAVSCWDGNISGTKSAFRPRSYPTRTTSLSAVAMERSKLWPRRGAADYDEAEAEDQRSQDAGLLFAGRSFDFLGYRIGRCYSTKTGKTYLGTTPSKKRVQRIYREISEATQARFIQRDTQAVVKTINQKLIGWSNYFCLGPVSKAYRAVDKHTVDRLRRWLSIKHKLQAGRIARFSDEILYAKFGLARLTQRTANFPWAKA